MPSLVVRKYADIAAMVQSARQDRGLTQAELAQRLAFSRDYVGDLETARPTLHMTRLLRVLHELGVTMQLSYAPPDSQGAGTDHAQS
jgi:HTH-type transcriptional regulator/antitoxin HipB